MKHDTFEGYRQSDLRIRQQCVTLARELLA